MFTNGIKHWVENIPGSEIKYPFIISDIILGSDNKTLISYDSLKGEETNQLSIKTFVQTDRFNFKLDK